MWILERVSSSSVVRGDGVLTATKGSSITITSLRSSRSFEKKLGGKEDVLKRVDIKDGLCERSVQHLLWRQ
jgi:hypothetical protein